MKNNSIWGYFCKDSRILKGSVLVAIAAVFSIGGFFVSHANAQTVDPAAALGVTGITAIANSSGTVGYATADNTYADGWRWVFNVTVPNGQTLLKMKFADWTNGSTIIPAGGNIQIYSAQSTNAMNEANAISITASSTWSDLMDIDPGADLDVNQGGRQIQIVVETKIPTGSAGGSYSTSYGINTTATSSITFGSTTQTYNGTPEAVSITTDPINLATTVTYSGTNYTSTTTAPTHVGTYAVNAVITDPGYTGTSTATLTINPEPIAVTANTQTKVYDGATSTDPALTYTVIPSIYSGDSFTGALARDPGENAGQYLIATGTLAIDGDYAMAFVPNYFVITQAPATVTLGSLEQTYDKIGKSVSTTTNPSGLAVSVMYDGSLTLPVNAGTHTVVATITDPNYEGSTTDNLVIDRAPLTVTATTSTKIYDGTTSSTGIPTITSGALIGSDTATWTQTFDTKDVRTNVLTPAGIVNDGNNGNNYYVTFVTTAGTITPATATVSAIGNNKVYDGTTDATVTLNVTGAVGTDVLTATDTAAFENKNVGNVIPVDVTGITISGSGVTANDYTYNTTANTTADITTAPLTITANNATKTYGDTLTFAGTEFKATGLLDDDSVTSVTLTSDGAASTSPIGSYSIVPSAATGTAGLTSNYTIAYNPGNLTVNKNNLTATIVAENKTYDGTASSAITSCSLNGIVNNDLVSCTATNGSFSDKNVGTEKMVTADVSLSGTDANYTVTSPATTTANIIALPITVTAVTDSKVYDGTTTSTGIPTITSITTPSTTGGAVSVTSPSTTGGDKTGGATLITTTLIAGDTSTTSQVFDSKDVGSRSLIPSITIDDGNGGSNYNVTLVNATGTITQRDLTVTASGTDKVYDGNNTGTVMLSDNRVADDNLTDSNTSATFENSNIGNNIPIDVFGISISGPDSNNYNLTNDSASTTANITQAPLTITANNTSKIYGDTLTFAGTEFTTDPSSLFGTDKVSSVILTSNGMASTSPVNDYDITASDATGTGLGNYSITYGNGSLSVTPLALVGTLTASNKPYDGTRNVSTSCTLSGVLFGDNVSCVIPDSIFSTRNAGTNQVTADLALSGTDKNNYSVNLTASTTATINELAITVTAQANTKTYDGTTDATIAPAFTPALGLGDTASFIETYNDKNVGTGKTLTPSGTVTDSNSGNNYSYTFASSTAGVITAEPLIITATTNTKVYDGNISVAAIPTVTSGTIFGSDKLSLSCIETYDTAIVNIGKTLTPSSSCNVNDSNNGLNYTYTLNPVTTGVITQAMPELSYGTNNVVDGETYSESMLSNPFAWIGSDSNKVDGNFVLDPVGGIISGPIGTPLQIGITFTPSDTTDFSTVNQTATFTVVGND